MIYAITMRRRDGDDQRQIEPGTPMHIKITTRASDEQPYLGFKTKELAVEFLKIKNLPDDDYYVGPAEELIASRYKNKSVLLFESMQQMIDAERNADDYDYEHLIHNNDL